METILVKIGEWLVDGETGSSSIYLCSLFLGAKPKDVAWPHDPADYNRCLGFLKLLRPSSVQPLLIKAARHNDHWKVIYDNWVELVALYQEEKDLARRPKLYNLMVKLGL